MSTVNKDMAFAMKFGAGAVEALAPRERDALLERDLLLGSTTLDDEDPVFYRLLGARMGGITPETAKRYLTKALRNLAAHQKGVKPEDVVDVRKEMLSICRKFGLEPRWVRSIRVTPKMAVVEVYLKDDDGEKYLDDWGKPAAEKRIYVVIA